MSLHAQLSPEAQTQLHAQQRNSTITSIIISILAVLLVGVILLYLLLPPIDNYTPPEIVAYQGGAEEKDKVTKRIIKRAVKRTPTAPSSSMAKVIASNSTSSIAIPVPDVDVLTPSMDFGNGESFGDDWGFGEDFGGGFGGIPSSMRKRCTAEGRFERLDENGGNFKCEKAVIKALNWLKENQEENGSWSHLPAKETKNPDQYRAAMTGFALLAFLGHCESPKSEEFGDTVNGAIIYLIDIGMKNEGKLTTTPGHHWVYEHGIATYALAEAYTFCLGLGIHIPNLGKVTQKAGDIVMDGQSSSGSWVYGYGGGGGDNSVGYWQIQAVKACKLTGLWKGKKGKSKFTKVFKKAEEWFSKVQGENGTFGYRANPAQNPGLTGGGVLSLQMMGLGDSDAAKAGIKYVANSIKDKPFHLGHLYYHYYNAQAMINHGGTEWKKYNKFFRNDLIDLQNKDGSWPAAGGHGSVNPVMATCLCTFMLEVYYRFLPTSEL